MTLKIPPGMSFTDMLAMLETAYDSKTLFEYQRADGQVSEPNHKQLAMPHIFTNLRGILQPNRSSESTKRYTGNDFAQLRLIAVQ
jgi:hypothetical protein